eukprot:GGOE01061486.1.p1 GENE.GGOE01061486.1~~GGOE01061486.1.p1  ORF type:complete len:356 (+),score=46.43 GGOE01061486.1:66-1133(+)
MEMPSPVSPFHKLTADVLWEIVSFLPRCAQLCARNSCQALRISVMAHFNVVAALARIDMTECADPGARCAKRLLAFGLPAFRHLCCLQFSGLRDLIDDVTCALLGFVAPPTLTSVDVSSCSHVTNLGVHLLTRGSLGASLKHLDLTFTNTDYAIVLHLYRKCSGLLVRRQPAWLDGHFQCPWNEVHTYHIDGSFQFTRSRESRGFVWCLRNHGDFLTIKIQYLDVTILPGVPFFRPGVLLKWQEDHVVVVQARWQLDPPDEFPPGQSYAALPIGKSMPLQTNDGVLLVSRIKVVPLEGDQLRPPEALVDEIEARLSGLLFLQRNYEEETQALCCAHPQEPYFKLPFPWLSPEPAI